MDDRTISVHFGQYFFRELVRDFKLVGSGVEIRE